MNSYLIAACVPLAVLAIELFGEQYNLRKKNREMSEDIFNISSEITDLRMFYDRQQKELMKLRAELEKVSNELAGTKETIAQMQENYGRFFGDAQIEGQYKLHF